MDAPTDKPPPREPRGRDLWAKGVKGVSGNPAGRPAGARCNATLALESLLDGQGKALTQKAVAMALDGDVGALKLCLDRIIPIRKDRALSIRLPNLSCAEDATAASAAVVNAVAEGRLTPSEGEALGRIIDGFVKALEVTDFNRRLKALEGRMTVVGE